MLYRTNILYFTIRGHKILHHSTQAIHVLRSTGLFSEEPLEGSHKIVRNHQVKACKKVLSGEESSRHYHLLALHELPITEKDYYGMNLFAVFDT